MYGGFGSPATTSSIGGTGTPGEFSFDGSATARTPASRDGFRVGSRRAPRSVTGGGGLSFGETHSDPTRIQQFHDDEEVARAEQVSRRNVQSSPETHSDPTRIQQFHDDEEVARAEQEEMDREYALSLQGSMGAGHFGALDHLSTIWSAPRAEPVPTAQHQPSRRDRRRNPRQLRGLSTSERGMTENNPQSDNYESRQNQVITQFIGQPIMDEWNSLLCPAEIESHTSVTGSSEMNQEPLRSYEADLPWQDFIARGGGRERGGRRRSASPDGQDYETLLALSERLGEVKQRGLSRKEIAQLPIITCKKQTDGDAVENCNICMEIFDEGQRKKYLPCLHCFHVSCIDRWIKKHASCPICRVDIKKMGALPDAGDQST